MTPEQFCYWLQGRAELQPGKAPSAEEWKSICEHLATVFNKVTPPVVIPSHIPPTSPTTDPRPSWEWWRTECKANGGQTITTC